MGHACTPRIAKRQDTDGRFQANEDAGRLPARRDTGSMRFVTD
jgi:hypothetical protein